jgi:hypothetical protein
MAQAFYKVLCDFGIENKVSAFFDTDTVVLTILLGSKYHM